MAETVAWSKCHSCGGSVAVKINRSSRAYYNCDHCYVKFEHKSQKESDKYIQSIGAAPGAPAPSPQAAPKPAPAPAPKPTKTPAPSGTFF